MKLPTISKDCNNKLTTVTIGELDLYFSYETVVAFKHVSTGLVVHENDWGPTTGRHLTVIDDGNKADRISSDEFDKQLDALLKSYKSVMVDPMEATRRIDVLHDSIKHE